MREFQERRRMKRLLHSRYAIAVLAIIALLFARGVWTVYQKYQASKQIAERVRADLASLQARQDSVDQAIASLDTEQGKDTEIRDRFGVLKPGEKMVVLVDDAATSSPATSTPSGFWARIAAFLGF